jgi:Ca2+-binding EF-hand superfamily protein
LRCFLRKYKVSLPEKDLVSLIGLFDQDVDGSLSFKEFITAMKPLLQFSLKAQNLGRPEVTINEAKPD